MQPAVELKHVSFSYGSKPILQNVSIAIEPGSYIGVIGDNGVGKSTLLKLILHEHCVSAGELDLLGTPVGRFRNWQRVGYLPQAVRNTEFPATAEEVVAMNLYSLSGPLRLPVKNGRKRVAEALEFVGMTEHAKSLFGTLSGGQIKRVMLARALVSDPDIILLDEPTAGLDQEAQAGLYGLLARRNKEFGVTILMVTHSPADVQHDVTGFLEVKNKTIIPCHPREVCPVCREPHEGNIHVLVEEGQA